MHLADWPDPDAEGLPADDALVVRMERLRDAASAALRVREDAGLRVRLPLARATVAGEGAEDIAPLVTCWPTRSTSSRWCLPTTYPPTLRWC